MGLAPWVAERLKTPIRRPSAPPAGAIALPSLPWRFGLESRLPLWARRGGAGLSWGGGGGQRGFVGAGSSDLAPPPRSPGQTGLKRLAEMERLWRKERPPRGVFSLPSSGHGAGHGGNWFRAPTREPPSTSPPRARSRRRPEGCWPPSPGTSGTPRALAPQPPDQLEVPATGGHPHHAPGHREALLLDQPTTAPAPCPNLVRRTRVVTRSGKGGRRKSREEKKKNGLG